jgi:UDP-glucuronate 4-epimerase
MHRTPTENQDWRSGASDASQSSAPYKIYNIGNSKPVQLMHFVEAIEDELGRKAVKEFLPMQPGDVQSTFADVSDLTRDTGYQPATNVREGVKNFIHWYRQYYGVR